MCYLSSFSLFAPSSCQGAPRSWRSLRLFPWGMEHSVYKLHMNSVSILFLMKYSVSKPILRKQSSDVGRSDQMYRNLRHELLLLPFLNTLLVQLLSVLVTRAALLLLFQLLLDALPLLHQGRHFGLSLLQSHRWEEESCVT